MNAEDPRASPRRRLVVPAQLVLPDPPAMAVRTLDVGAEGACVMAPAALRSNTVCELRFTLPVERAKPCGLALRARVVYVVLNRQNGFRVGLHFLSVTPDVGVLLNRFVHQHRPVDAAASENAQPDGAGR
jgi:hypothetical protein